MHFAEVAKLADALDLGSSGRKTVGVRVPPSAQTGQCPTSPPSSTGPPSLLVFLRVRCSVWSELTLSAQVVNRMDWLGISR